MDPEASICNRNEMSEFEKYLTDNSYTEQKNINDGAAVLTVTLTGHDNDCISVQKSVEDDVVNAEDDSEKDAGRNSGDVEGVENSRIEDKIENAEDDIGNAAGRNSRDAECVENSNSESSNSDEEYKQATTKQENPEEEQSEMGDSESSTSDKEDGLVIDDDENSEVEESEGGNTEQLEGDSDTDSNSSEEEGDVVGNKSGNP